jgi:REP element-mobilizing transposase RayT
MQKTEKLQNGKFYHIYNCGINGDDLFKASEDYEHFMNLYEKYIEPVCETFAWVLMKNHFHFFVKIKEGIVYKHSNEDGSIDNERFKLIRWETIEYKPDGLQNLSGLIGSQEQADSDLIESDGLQNSNIILKVPKPHLHFSHLFNAYAKHFNIRYHRHGSLFERQFKRKEVDNKEYFRSLVLYIHQNPVHHGFCEHPMDYGWSSYLTCISIKETKLKRQEVMGWFNGAGDFKYYHDNILQTTSIEEWLGL